METGEGAGADQVKATNTEVRRAMDRWWLDGIIGYLDCLTFVKQLSQELLKLLYLKYYHKILRSS